MKRSWIKRSQKPLRRTPLKRGTSQLKRTPLKRGIVQLKRTPLARYSKLKMRSDSDTSLLKERIQDTLRLLVMLRDGGCILRNVYGIPGCNGHKKNGELVLQADHLITRANSATYADSRLVVCVCKGHHGWKKYHENQYNEVVKKVIEPERVLLWEKCEAERWRATPMGAYDWKLSLIVLERELVALGGTPLPSFDVS